MKRAATLLLLAYLMGVNPGSGEAATPITEREARRDTTGLSGTLLRAGSTRDRASAARALGRIQNRGSVPALVLALRDRKTEVRHEAAFALGLVGDSSAAPSVASRLTAEPEAEVRIALITALGYLGARSEGPAIAKALHSSQPSERWAAALAAGRSRDSSLVDPLAAIVSDPDPDLRWRAAYALGRIADRRAGPALQTLLGDKDETVRFTAARALGDVGDSSAASVLIRSVGDRAWRVRVNAAHALGSLGAKEAASSIRPLLSDPNPHVRWEAVLTLGALRDSTAAPALTAALRDSATGVVQGAALALIRIQGEDAIPVVAPVFDLLPGFLRSGLIEGLGDLTGPTSLEILIARLGDDSDPAQAIGAASALGKRMGDRAAALLALRERLSAKDFAVVSSAAEALGALGDSSAVGDLTRLLDRGRSPEDADVAASAATALAALKTTAALDALRPARRSWERRVREIATAALGLPSDSVLAQPAPPLRIDPIRSRAAKSATVTTVRGAFRIELHSKTAPRAVFNFARLARSGYFNGLAYHRVVPNFVVQDGCPRGDGWGGPGYAIPCEWNELPYRTGTVGMALSGKDTGGSQWFVTLSPQPRLEGRYTVFGDVVSGMDVVERLMPGDRILRIDVR